MKNKLSQYLAEFIGTYFMIFFGWSLDSYSDQGQVDSNDDSGNDHDNEKHTANNHRNSNGNRK